MKLDKDKGLIAGRIIGVFVFKKHIMTQEVIMASSISKELQEFVKGKLGWVATLIRRACPMSLPKALFRCWTKTRLFCRSLFSQNQGQSQEQPKVAVTLVDHEKFIGYQFKGKAELSTAVNLREGREELKKAPNAPEPNTWQRSQLKRFLISLLVPTQKKIG